MRLAVLTLLTLLSAVAVVHSLPQLFVVEVAVLKDGDRESRFFLLEWNGDATITLPVEPGVEGLVVRVDSSTPYKPYAVFLDGANVVACYEEGVVVIEDFAWINFTRLGWRPRAVTVRFERSNPKPPIYALHERGDGVWGYLIEALCSDARALANLTGFKVTIVTRRLLKVQASLGDVLLWDVVLLQTGGEPDPLLELLRRVSIELRVKTLYYSAAPDRQPLYFYVNVPAACSARVDTQMRAWDLVGRLFPGNPALYAPQATVSMGSCAVTFVNPGPLDYVVSGVLVPARSRREAALTPVSQLSVEAFKRGVKVYAFTIHGAATVLELPSFAYNVDVYVVDSWGKPVSNATVTISGVNNTLREFCKLVNGACSFTEIPPGMYMVSAYVGAREVGRTLVTVERCSSAAIIKADLNDFEVSVLYPTGEKITGYTVVLRGYGLRFEARETRGYAAFRGVPSGLYDYEVIKDGVILASGPLKVEARRQGYAIVANVSKVYLKVLDFLGRPLPRVNVQIKGSVSVLGQTDERGELAIDLPFGEYEIKVEAIRFSRRVSVRSGGEYFTLSGGIPLQYLIAALIVAAAVAAIKGLRGKRGIEVIDLED